MASPCSPTYDFPVFEEMMLTWLKSWKVLTDKMYADRERGQNDSVPIFSWTCRHERIEPSLPGKSLLLLLQPREEAAVQQAEEVDVEQLIRDGHEPEVGHLNDGPQGPLQDECRDGTALHVFLHLRHRFARGEPHVGEEEQQVDGAEDDHV